MYRALYRKWRPQRFEDVVGQRATVAALKNQMYDQMIEMEQAAIGWPAEQPAGNRSA